jgi:hypothetical protein
MSKWYFMILRMLLSVQYNQVALPNLIQSEFNLTAAERDIT